MKYLYIDDNNAIGFKIEGTHEILSTDVPIDNEIYERYFDLETQGKHFKIRNIHGTTFEEIFEEIILGVTEPQPQIPSMEDRVAAIEEALLNMI